MKNTVTKKTKSFTIAFFTLAYLFLTAPIGALAADTKDQWKNAGITPDKSIDSSGVYSDLTTLIGVVIAFGGFWIIACLIFAGIKLASAQGGNPQARTSGFIGIGMAFIGGWVIMKSYDIAGFIAGFGG